MKYVVVSLLILFFTSCSVKWNTKYLTPVSIEKSLKAKLYDWETEMYGGPSFGFIRPEMYGYKIDKSYFFIYPRIILDESYIGPPIIPLIKNTSTINENSMFELRMFNPTRVGSTKPLVMKLFNNDILQKSCNLIKKKEDVVGIKYKCNENVNFPNIMPTKLVVLFSNSNSITIPLKINNISGYAPLVSFNGPNAKPSISILEDGNLHIFPEVKK